VLFVLVRSGSSPMNGSDYIPVPWRFRWRRFCQRIVPLLACSLLFSATFWLWKQQAPFAHAVGEVECVRLEVRAGTAGTVTPLPHSPWSLFDTVEARQILVQLDDQPVQLRLRTFNQELARLRREFDSVAAALTIQEADRADVHQREAVRLQTDLEQRRLTVLEQRIQVESRRLELQRHTLRLECMTPLYDKKMIPELEYTTEKMLRDEAAGRLAAGAKALGEAETQQAAAQRRIKELADLVRADVAKQLAPLTAATEVQMSRIREVEAEIGNLAIRAPISGTICGVHCWPGQVVQAGDPVVTLAAQQGRYIVSYLRQAQRLDPQIGMAVSLRPRGLNRAPLMATVERVGPQVEPVPLHQCRDPKIPEWGLPVRISLPQDFLGRPGDLLDITFHTSPHHEG